MYRMPFGPLMGVMKLNSHLFSGRGRGNEQFTEPYRLIECADGIVCAIIVTYSGVEFLRGYCRKALIDKWGIHCFAPFVQGSDPTFSRTWAVPMNKDLILFRKTSLELVPERDWMRVTER